jgi:hypothetical protein
MLTAGDTLSSLPGSGAIKSMPQAEIAQAVQLLDLMLEERQSHRS